MTYWYSTYPADLNKILKTESVNVLRSESDKISAGGLTGSERAAVSGGNNLQAWRDDKRKCNEVRVRMKRGIH